MSERETPSPADAAIVAAQLGREPRTPWRVAVRCPHGLPRVIACPSRLDDGSPFPTTFWLTCNGWWEAVSEIESRGGVGDWEARLAEDPELAARAARAAAAYAAARAKESGGTDACAGTGIAGVRRDASVKCLHARVAAYLAGAGDPVGEGVAAELPEACEDERCRELAALWEELAQ